MRRANLGVKKKSKGYTVNLRCTKSKYLASNPWMNLTIRFRFLLLPLGSLGNTSGVTFIRAIFREFNWARQAIALRLLCGTSKRLFFIHKHSNYH